jgi:hypothetical protein
MREMIGRPSSASPAFQVHVDATFAVDFARFLDRPTASGRSALKRHPAFSAVRRHRSMTSRVLDDSLLDGMIGSAAGVFRTSAGSARPTMGERLSAAIASAADYLPAGWSFPGTVYVVLGYDIGAAAPPDVILNAAAPQFLADAEEVALWAAHEAHHVGFMAARPAPAATGLNDARRLLGLIRYMTQLEGMAVHATYAARARAERLHRDGDYLVYASAEERGRVLRGYASLRDAVAGRPSLEAGEVDAVLTSMSSGARLWYRFGALVSRTIEERHGREALVAAIADPRLFDETADELMRPHGGSRLRSG